MESTDFHRRRFEAQMNYLELINKGVFKHNAERAKLQIPSLMGKMAAEELGNFLKKRR